MAATQRCSMYVSTGFEQSLTHLRFPFPLVHIPLRSSRTSDDRSTHSNPRRTDHYHAIPTAFFNCSTGWDSVNHAWADAAPNGQHSPPIGWALDGYPIFGPYSIGGAVPTDLDSCYGHVRARVNPSHRTSSTHIQMLWFFPLEEAFLPLPPAVSPADAVSLPREAHPRRLDQRLPRLHDGEAPYPVIRRRG